MKAKNNKRVNATKIVQLDDKARAELETLNRYLFDRLIGIEKEKGQLPDGVWVAFNKLCEPVGMEVRTCAETKA